jgi:hypothetical protein
MFVIYGLLLIAMIFGISMLFVRQKKRGAQVERKSLRDVPGPAKTNEGGNSQRAENSAGGSSGHSDYDQNSMGADNDEDIYKSTAANAQRKEDFNNYGA